MKKIANDKYVDGELLASVVRKADNSIHRINHYPADSVVCFVNTYPLDSDLSAGHKRCPAFEQLGPGEWNCLTLITYRPSCIINQVTLY